MYRGSRLMKSALSQRNSCIVAINSSRAFASLSKPTPARLLFPTRSQIPRASLLTVRFNSSLTVHQSEKANPQEKPPAPAYQLTFTCKPCSHRSSHRVSKQGYHHGTVLITCPSCKNRHVVADHLKIFMDEKSTLEDILKRTSEGGDLSKLLKKGRLGMREGQLVGNEGEEDIEFWEDGSESKHAGEAAQNK